MIRPSKTKRLKPRSGQIVAVAAVAALLALLLFMPWQGAAERRLTAFLETQGFEHVTLHLSHLGWHEAVLRDIAFGQDQALSLSELRAAYSPRALSRRQAEKISIKGLSLDVARSGDAWRIGGLPPGSGAGAGTKTLPVTPADLAHLPFTALSVSDSAVRVAAPGWTAHAPFSLDLDRAETPRLDVNLDQARLEMGDLEAIAARLTLSARWREDAQNWSGSWSVQGLTLTGLPEALPLLNGGGAVLASAERVSIEGTLKSDDGTYALSFRADYPAADPASATIALSKLQMPWMEGRLSIGDMILTPARQDNIRIPLDVSRLSVGKLMESFTGERVVATGAVSGRMPLVVTPGGDFNFETGSLHAEGPGTIAMPPDLFPGGGDQVALVREVLANLHYDVLSISMENRGGNALTILLSVEGRNPDAYDGRTVKLNVRLSGDVINFVRQNMMLLTRTTDLLKQGKE